MPKEKPNAKKVRDEKMGRGIDGQFQDSIRNRMIAYFTRLKKRTRSTPLQKKGEFPRKKKEKENVCTARSTHRTPSAG